MGHRRILTERQLNKLMALPSEEHIILQHYVLSDEDLTNIHRCLNAHNRLGFALQLCAFRYPGRYLRKGEVIPAPMLSFVANQLGVEEGAIVDYALRQETRNSHINKLRAIYGYQPYSKIDKAQSWSWLLEAALQANSSLDLVEFFLQECRHRKIILPGITMIERLCADAKVAAERSITKHIFSNIDSRMKKRLYAMLEETIDGRMTVYAWLRRFEIGNNSADFNKLMMSAE